ncbi:N-acetylglucosamine kinase [Phytohabitans houttuyneae]|uniref:ATPase n=1 Tax=Phytohabitans houttuyneae TaxID=1076126 RepID=A0A6V8KHY4_9ACTN|nr:BadF/BadG/BcrA/BcrD ATPase family protein [Phytohabitans houttuyneae]GFJ81616.1 ATPase [Phytohabitans houttuyneae]
MSAAIAGIDAGGTKTTILVEALDGRRVATVDIPSTGWNAEPVEAGAGWIDAALRRATPPGCEVVALGVGAQGLDSTALAHAFTAALAARGHRAVAVNDAALLVPAAGLDDGIGVISGTGAIGVGRDASGQWLFTGGWGAVIGDEGGAAGLVREATRLALGAHDDGEPDDGLLSALCDAFGAGTAERLARAVNDEPTTDNWGPRAPAVFAAADRGSALAARAVQDAADHLSTLVDQLVRRGAAGGDVVAAGGVVTHQPRLYEAFASRVAARHPDLTVHLLTGPPAAGALALARRLVTP